MENMLTTTVYSFTKDRSYEVCVSSDYLCPGDKVLFIDDFLAMVMRQRNHRPGTKGRSRTCGYGIFDREVIPAWW